MTPVLSSYWGLSINGKSQQHFALFDTFDIGFLSYRSVNHFPGSLSHSASLSLFVSLSLFLLSSFFLAGIQFHTWGSRMRGRSGLCQQRPAFFPFFCWYRKNEERESKSFKYLSFTHSSRYWLLLLSLSAVVWPRNRGYENNNLSFNFVLTSSWRWIQHKHCYSTRFL